MEFPGDLSLRDHQGVWLLLHTLGNVSEVQVVPTDVQKGRWIH